MKSIIESLGDCRFRSPLPHMDGHRARFKLDSDQIVCDDRLNRENVHDAAEEPSLTFEVAGPREHLYFDSANTTAAIVTCGGLSPGVNDVIRGIVMELWHEYRVKKILGIRYGYEGLVQRHGRQPFQLRPEVVSMIQTFGGTMLGTSRGPQNATEMVDSLEHLDIESCSLSVGMGLSKAAPHSFRRSLVEVSARVSSEFPKPLTTTFHTWTRVSVLKRPLPRP
jgi:6-phosphofructokinase 1